MTWSSECSASQSNVTVSLTKATTTSPMVGVIVDSDDDDVDERATKTTLKIKRKNVFRIFVTNWEKLEKNFQRKLFLQKCFFFVRVKNSFFHIFVERGVSSKSDFSSFRKKQESIQSRKSLCWEKYVF